MNAPPPIPGIMFTNAVMAAVVAALAFWFAWRYHRVRWSATAEGRHLMRFSLLVGLTFGITAAVGLLGLFVMIAEFWTLLGLVLVQFALFLWAALEMYARNVLFTEAQRKPE